MKAGSVEGDKKNWIIQTDKAVKEEGRDGGKKDKKNEEREDKEGRKYRWREEEVRM